jgi:hypothetical protein
MHRMSDAEFNAHNDRAAQSRLAKERYSQSLTPEIMIREMQENPSSQKFKIFNERFTEMMDAQTHIVGAESVAKDWEAMTEAYNKFVSDAMSRWSR